MCLRQLQPGMAERDAAKTCSIGINTMCATCGCANADHGIVLDLNTGKHFHFGESVPHTHAEGEGHHEHFSKTIPTNLAPSALSDRSTLPTQIKVIERELLARNNSRADSVRNHLKSQ